MKKFFALMLGMTLSNCGVPESSDLSGNIVKVSNGALSRAVFGIHEGKAVVWICSNSDSYTYRSLTSCANPVDLKAPKKWELYQQDLDIRLGLDIPKSSVEEKLRKAESGLAEMEKEISDLMQEGIQQEAQDALRIAINDTKNHIETLKNVLTRYDLATQIRTSVLEAFDESKRLSFYLSRNYIAAERYALAAFDSVSEMPKVTELAESFARELSEGLYLSTDDSACPFILENAGSSSILSLRLLGRCAGRRFYFQCRSRTCENLSKLAPKYASFTFIPQGEISFDGNQIVRTTKVVPSSSSRSRNCPEKTPFDNEPTVTETETSTNHVYRRSTDSVEPTLSNIKWDSVFKNYDASSFQMGSVRNQRDEDQKSDCILKLDPTFSGAEKNRRLASVAITSFGRVNECPVGFKVDQVTVLACQTSSFTCENSRMLLSFLTGKSIETVTSNGAGTFDVRKWGTTSDTFGSSNGFRLSLADKDISQSLGEN